MSPCELWDRLAARSINDLHPRAVPVLDKRAGGPGPSEHRQIKVDKRRPRVRLEEGCRRVATIEAHFANMRI